MFYQFDDEDDVLTAEDKLQLAKGILKVSLIKTGIGVAMSAGLKQSAKEHRKKFNPKRKIY